MVLKNKSLVKNPLTVGLLGKLVVTSTALIILWIILLTTFLRHASTHTVGIIDSIVLIDFLLWIIVIPIFIFRIHQNHLTNANNNFRQPSTLSKILVIVLMTVVILLAGLAYLIFYLLTHQPQLG